jgi:hypothetical protein
LASISIFKRKEHRGALINFTEHGVQVARLASLHERPLLIDCLAEFPLHEEEETAQWFEKAFPERAAVYVPAYCGFHPEERIVSREAVNLRRLDEPAYLQGLVCEHAKIDAASAWQINLLHPSEGMPLTQTGSPRAGLLVAVPDERIREIQPQVLKWGVYPQRLELGTVPLLGGLARHLELNAYPNALVVCEITQSQTRAYLLGKDGVHTPAHLPHGLRSIEEIVVKEFGAEDIAAARRLLEEPSENLRAHSRRLVRILARHLRPAVDYFEMQTGQRSGALFCAQLPARLSWLAQALSAAVDLELFSPDFSMWLPTVGLNTPEPSNLGPSWFQPLSLIAQLAPLSYEPAS